MKLLHVLAALVAASGCVKAATDADKWGVAQILVDDEACPAPSTVTVTASPQQTAQAAAPSKAPSGPITETDTETVTEYVTVGDDDARGTTRTTTTTTKQVTVTKGSGRKQTPQAACTTSAAPETTVTRTLYEIHTLESQCAVPGAPVPTGQNDRGNGKQSGANSPAHPEAPNGQTPNCSAGGTKGMSMQTGANMKPSPVMTG